MTKIPELDKFTDYFDDVWVYQTSDNQGSYLWVINKDRHTPLEDDITFSSDYKGDVAVHIMQPSHCNWVLKKELDEKISNAYLDALLKLAKANNDARMGKGKIYTKGFPLKLKDLFVV